MIKKITFIFLVITSFSFTLFSALNSNHWKVITKDIARDGDHKDKNEFEAAKQAFLHIKDDAEAQEAAMEIQKKWYKSFGVEAKAGTKTQSDTLMNLTRYPLMTKQDAQDAVKKLLKNRKVVKFLDEQKLKIISP